jgi:hypothetical protein
VAECGGVASENGEKVDMTALLYPFKDCCMRGKELEEFKRPFEEGPNVVEDDVGEKNRGGGDAIA